MDFSFAMFFIVALTSIHSGAGLECYSCNSKNDPTCMESDKLDSFKSDCNTKAVEEARKALSSVSHTISDWGSMLGLNIGKSSAIDEADLICQKVDVETKDKTYTVRSCSIAKKDSNEMCEFLKTKMTTDTVKVKHCSQCKDNLCNSSSGVTPTIISIFTVFIAVLFYQQ